MPNWCSNYVTFTAPSTQAFANFVEHMNRHWDWTPPEEDVTDRDREEPAGFCGYFVPEPDYDNTKIFPAYPELHKQDKFTMPGWWDFRVSNWGTKWEPNVDRDAATIDEDSLTISFWFDSAWSPPTGVYQSATDQEWNVEANYCEPGMAFIGYFTSAEGEETFELTNRKYSDAPEWLMDAYEYEYECIDEYERENDLTEERLSREEFLEKHGEDYIHEWDNFHKQEASN